MGDMQGSLDGFSGKASAAGVSGESQEGQKKRGDEEILGVELKPGQAVYSHSRLSTFEQCPQKFKFAYVDKLESEIEGSIESFLGSRVHDTLEKLYTDLKFEKENTLQELLDFFNSEWERHWTDNVLIVRKEYSSDNYRKMGERFIVDYHNRYKPFNQAKTIGLEMRIVIRLDPEGRHVLQGFIDRLAYAGEGVYEVHDYKTANSLPEQDKVDVDRQLALYAIAVKEKYKDCRKVVLVWHYLAFDKELRSERTDEQLEKLKKDTINVIKEIESAKEYPLKESALCQWCEYRPVCPRWRHLYETEKLEPVAYRKEEGVRLANEYSELKDKEKEIADKIAKISEKIMVFAEQHKVDRVYGSDSKVTIWQKSCVKFPGKTDPGYPDLVKALRESGGLEEFSTIDRWKLEKAFEQIDMDPKVMQAIAKYGKRELLKRLYLGKRG
ncbi:PD-(D/E)XK nuclease family protein [Candidatus Woesearchaeota archaeon]|nr:PD-(D/E)XK nuclease family protein [Candidatus Woesearchaeota archaeon]